MNREKLSQEEKVEVSRGLVEELKRYQFEDALYVLGSTLALMGLGSEITDKEVDDSAVCGAALCNLMGGLNDSGSLHVMILASALLTLASHAHVIVLDPEVQNE